MFVFIAAGTSVFKARYKLPST